MFKKPSKYLIGQGAVCLGPLAVGTVRLIPWRGYNWFECTNGTAKVLYKKHFIKPTTTKPITWDTTIQSFIEEREFELAKNKEKEKTKRK